MLLCSSTRRSAVRRNQVSKVAWERLISSSPRVARQTCRRSMPQRLPLFSPRQRVSGAALRPPGPCWGDAENSSNFSTRTTRRASIVTPRGGAPLGYSQPHRNAIGGGATVPELTPWRIPDDTSLPRSAHLAALGQAALLAPGPHGGATPRPH